MEQMTSKQCWLLVLSCVLLLVLMLWSVEVRYEEKEEPFPEFPSYDWSAEDADLLARVAANTEGSVRDKQKAQIEVLEVVWDLLIPIDKAIEYLDLDLTKDPTPEDKDLVSLLPQQEWAD